jgi:hypothetical protein
MAGTALIRLFRPFEAESSRFNYGILKELFYPVLSLTALHIQKFNC